MELCSRVCSVVTHIIFRDCNLKYIYAVIGNMAQVVFLSTRVLSRHFPKQKYFLICRISISKALTIALVGQGIKGSRLNPH